MSNSALPQTVWKLPLGAKFLLLLGVAAATLGCGHPATEQECQEILRRAAQLELQERLGSRELIESEVDEIERSMKEPMMNKCVGKRITKSALRCIRSAKNADALFNECF